MPARFGYDDKTVYFSGKETDLNPQEFYASSDCKTVRNIDGTFKFTNVERYKVGNLHFKNYP